MSYHSCVLAADLPYLIPPGPACRHIEVRLVIDVRPLPQLGIVRPDHLQQVSNATREHAHAWNMEFRRRAYRHAAMQHVPMHGTLPRQASRSQDPHLDSYKGCVVLAGA